MAFCAGWLRPRVYVSTAVLDRLSSAELRAVLAHEQHHGALRDPLRLAVSRVLCQALFFLPVLRPLHDRYADVAEISADAAALEASGGAPGPLASAMLAFGATPAGGVVGISPERVDVLLGEARRAWRLPRLLLVAALLTLVVLVALVVAGEPQRVRPGDAEPADRLLAAVRARARARAGARVPRGRRRPPRRARRGAPLRGLTAASGRPAGVASQGLTRIYDSM